MSNLTDADFLDQLEEVAKGMHPDSYLIPVNAGQVAALIADLRAARQERDKAREALLAGTEQVSRLAGLISGLLEHDYEGYKPPSCVVDALRWEIQARQILGLKPEAVLSDDFSPWAIAMRAALAATKETCPTCHGTGLIELHEDNPDADFEPCPDCAATKEEKTDG